MMISNSWQWTLENGGSISETVVHVILTATTRNGEKRTKQFKN